MRAIALTPQARQFSYKVLIHPVSMILDVQALLQHIINGVAEIVVLRSDFPYALMGALRIC